MVFLRLQKPKVLLVFGVDFRQLCKYNLQFLNNFNIKINGFHYSQLISLFFNF